MTAGGSAVNGREASDEMPRRLLDRAAGPLLTLGSCRTKRIAPAFVACALAVSLALLRRRAGVQPVAVSLTAPAAPPTEQARGPTSYANVHKGSGRAR